MKMDSPLNGTRKVLNKHKYGVRSTQYVLFAPETNPQHHKHHKCQMY